MTELPAETHEWLLRRTFGSCRLDPYELSELKHRQGRRISVCLPALDEVGTIGHICHAIRTELMDDAGLVDELLVVDCGSADGTQASARAAGAVVHDAAAIRPGGSYDGTVSGKGDALWRSLAVMTGDVVVWLDSDVKNFDNAFVTRLVEPLLLDDDIVLTKGFYERPLQRDDGADATEGARVTELVVRPLLHLFFPALTGLIQPLSGEYALRREVAVRLPFFTRYGVDIGLLIDVAERYGLEAIAQVDLGTRLHAHQDVFALGQMAHQIMATMLWRADELGKLELGQPLADRLTQFLPTEEGWQSATTEVGVEQRPAMDGVAGAR